MVEEETERDDLMEKEEEVEETEWDALEAVKEEETERDALKTVEESVVRLVGKEKGVEEEQMKEVEGKKAMVVEETLVVAARTVAAVKLKEEVKGSLAVAVGERSQVV